MENNVDVMIYIQKLRTFIEKDKDNRHYFNVESNPELFYSMVEEFATKNFKKTGDPSINIEQFELIREKMGTPPPSNMLTNSIWGFSLN